MKLAAHIWINSNNVRVFRTRIAIEEAVKPKLKFVYFLLWP
jgi:hypothetical protein